jgi:hypothetical protein
MLKKLLISFFAALVLLTSVSVAPVQAQSTWYNQGFYEWYRKVYDPEISDPSEIFGERYTAAQVEWIIWSIPSVIINTLVGPEVATCFLGIVFTGTGSLDTCLDLVFQVSEGEKIRYFAQREEPEPLIRQLLADRPLSGITYVKDKLRKFDVIPEAQAQGFGFIQALNPFQVFWRLSRDIVYSLFVVATIIMAFMVMFRVRLSPQTVVTVQYAIPKIIIALILVTFSYAIAGFLVDLMYVVIGILSLFYSSALANLAAGDSTPADVFNFITRGAIGAGIWGNVVLYLIMFVVTALVVAAGSFGISGLLVAGVVGALAALIGSALALPGLIVVLILVILLVVAIIALFIYVIKITSMLIKAFVNIFLLTIVAPFQILLGVFMPTMGFGPWVQSFASNLAVFVMTGALFLLSFLFLAMSLETVAGWGNNLWDILIGTTGTSMAIDPVPAGWPPLLAPTAEFTGFLYLGISFIIFTMIPKANEFVQSLIAGKPFAYGTALGEAVAPIGMPVRGIGAAGVDYYGEKLSGKFTAGSMQQKFIDSIKDILKGRLEK